MDNSPFDGLLSFGEATQLWSLHESTLRKAVAYGKFQEGQDIKKIWQTMGHHPRRHGAGIRPPTGPQGLKLPPTLLLWRAGGVSFYPRVM